MVGKKPVESMLSS